MEKYYELKDRNYNWHPAKLVNKENDSETFILFGNNKKVKLEKDNFDKRELSIQEIHLERLGFLNEEKNYIPKGGKILCPVYNIGRDSIQNLKWEFFGYILFETINKNRICANYTNIFEDYNADKIDKEEVTKRFDSFFTITELFKRLQKNGVGFNATEILKGKITN